VNRLLITCEHGGNRIPAPYRLLFKGYGSLLDSHRGYDMGALVMARELAAAFAAPLVAGTVSRLLVDLNRSPGHPGLHGDAIRGALADVRARIVERYYVPYRTKVERCVHQAVAAGHRVVHISSHSFTPKLDGKVRNADIGLLYDPARHGEVELCQRWQACLATCAPALVIRRNYPYAGKGDGLTNHLRRRYPPGEYVGVELEINQKYAIHSSPHWKALRKAVIASLRLALDAPPNFSSRRPS
jgi:predicted N-formylglutamate amidohydrolase